MSRFVTLALSALLLTTIAVQFVPAAEAAPRCWYTPVPEKVECLTDICVYGYSSDCIIYNPCDPRWCHWH